MRVNLGYLTLLVGCAGCGMLKDTSKSVNATHDQLDEQQATKLLVDANKTITAATLTLYTDSTNQDYSVQVWPKGRFTFSAANGFEGEAEQVLVTGKIRHQGSGSITTASKVADLTRTALQVSHKKKVLLDQKNTNKKSTVSLKGILSATAFLILIVFIFYKIKS